MMMKTILTKTAGFAASAGVGQVVRNVITSTIPVGLSNNRKALTAVGGFVVGSVLGGITVAHVEKQVGTFIDGFNIGKTVEE